MANIAQAFDRAVASTTLRHHFGLRPVHSHCASKVGIMLRLGGAAAHGTAQRHWQVRLPTLTWRYARWNRQQHDAIFFTDEPNFYLTMDDRRVMLCRRNGE